MVVLSLVCCLVSVFTNYLRAFAGSGVMDITSIVGNASAFAAALFSIVSVIVYAQGCQQQFVDNATSGYDFFYGPCFG